MLKQYPGKRLRDPKQCCKMLGLPGGFARILNSWGGVGWGGVGTVNVGVHVHTWYAAGTLLVCSCAHMVRCWYAAGVFMCTHGTLLVCHVQRCYAWGGVGWGLSTLVFMCTHGMLLVRCWCVHVYTWYAVGVSCAKVLRLGWGGVGTVNVGVHVYTWYAAGTLLVCSCVHMVRCWYAAGVFMCTHGTLLVRCWCVHVYTWYAVGVSCAKVLRLGWGGVGWGLSTLVFMCTHGTLLVRCWCVHVYTWYAAGTLLVCSCAHMVRCWCVMCKGFVVCRFLFLIGFNVFLLAMWLKNSAVFFLHSGGLCINQDVSWYASLGARRPLHQAIYSRKAFVTLSKPGCTDKKYKLNGSTCSPLLSAAARPSLPALLIDALIWPAKASHFWSPPTICILLPLVWKDPRIFFNARLAIFFNNKVCTGVYSDKECLACAWGRFNRWHAPCNPLLESLPTTCRLALVLEAIHGHTSSTVSGGPGALEDVLFRGKGNKSFLSLPRCVPSNNLPERTATEEAGFLRTAAGRFIRAFARAFAHAFSSLLSFFRFTAVRVESHSTIPSGSSVCKDMCICFHAQTKRTCRLTSATYSSDFPIMCTVASWGMRREAQ